MDTDNEESIINYGSILQKLITQCCRFCYAEISDLSSCPFVLKFKGTYIMFTSGRNRDEWYKILTELFRIFVRVRFPEFF